MSDHLNRFTAERKPVAAPAEAPKKSPSADESSGADSTRRALVAVPPKLDKKTELEADFNWSTNDSIILHEQPETACYFNNDGSLVIRQRCWPDEDAFIYITEPHIDKFLDKLTDIAGIPSVGKSS